MSNIKIYVGENRLTEKLRDVSIDMKYNTISSCEFAFYLDNGKTDVRKILQEKTVKILDCTNGTEKLLFIGLIDKCEIRQKYTEQTVKVSAVSFAKRLDEKKLSKSYQNVNLMYQDVIQQSLSACGEGSFSLMKTDQTTGMPYIQYEETSWQFAKRMASHLETVLYDQPYGEAPFFWVGAKDGCQMELTENVWETGIDEEYFIQGGKNAGLTRGDYQYYQIVTDQNYVFGGKVQFQSKEMIVYEKHAVFEKEVWKYIYKLGCPAIEKGRILYNAFFCGMSLSATVIAVEKELVKIQFDFDSSQSVDEAYFYPWAPFSGNSLYCPPIVQTKVSLYIDSNNEIRGKVINCNRTNGSTCPACQNTWERQIATPEGKNLFSDVDNLAFQNKEKESVVKKVSLEESGVEVKSDKPIKIIALGNVEVNGAECDVDSTQDLNLVQTGTEILGNDDIDPISAVNISDAEVNCVSEENQFEENGEAQPLVNPYFDDNPTQVSRWDVFASSLLKAFVAAVVVVTAVAALAALEVISCGTATAAIIGAGVALGGLVIADTISGNSSSLGSYLVTGTIGAITGAIGKAFQGGKILGEFGKKLAASKWGSIAFNAAMDISASVVQDETQIALDCNDNLNQGTVLEDAIWSGVFSVGTNCASDYIGSLLNKNKPHIDVNTRDGMDELLEKIGKLDPSDSQGYASSVLGELRDKTFLSHDDQYDILYKIYGNPGSKPKLLKAIKNDPQKLADALNLPPNELQDLLTGLMHEGEKTVGQNAIDSGIASLGNEAIWELSDDMRQNNTVGYYDSTNVGGTLKNAMVVVR